MKPLPPPDHEVRLNGLLLRKWVYPAQTFTDGGIRSERWVYAVGESPCVLTFSVATGRYPEGNPSIPPSAIAETLHRVGEGEHPCVYLDGQGCGNGGSGVDAHDWYDAQHKDQQGFVHDAAVYAHLRDLYTAWSQP